jgi:hypothetical protein
LHAISIPPRGLLCAFLADVLQSRQSVRAMADAEGDNSNKIGVANQVMLVDRLARNID